MVLYSGKAGSRQQAAGSRQQAAGSRQQAAGSRQQAYICCITNSLSLKKAIVVNYFILFLKILIKN
ncbi:hypothetical protein J3U66_01620 [Gilliamella sp. B2969]|uniref:hypothetical protein n=1 Tax=unclassified Gilliamella TaxID=2685620 RepID=UPI00226AC79E|nr:MULTISPECIES: hypothetical protein [unclassified Gilliamella]MCX8712068.1 hypothetical protein [Gilliamella sp. B3468]MCX8729076.1 hypothetical protein [Gilliamella sp. B2969]MCX8751387.1 hypothetical protein [Gilliamella sp. B3464]